jgi:hypothetical protein
MNYLNDPVFRNMDINDIFSHLTNSEIVKIKNKIINKRKYTRVEKDFSNLTLGILKTLDYDWDNIKGDYDGDYGNWSIPTKLLGHDVYIYFSILGYRPISKEFKKILVNVRNDPLVFRMDEDAIIIELY